MSGCCFFFFKQKTAYEIYQCDWSSDVCSSDLRLPVFAEMRNVIDLAIAAAFINQQDFYAQADWRAETFNDEQVATVETYNTPLHVESVCTAVFKGSRLYTPVGGGVTIRARDALRSQHSLADEDGQITQLRESIDLQDLPADRWWWD